MQRLEVSGAVRPLYGSLGVKGLKNMTRITGTLHEDQYTYLVIPRSVFLKTKNVSGKHFREYQNTHFVFTNIFRKSRFLFEIM